MTDTPRDPLPMSDVELERLREQSARMRANNMPQVIIDRLIATLDAARPTDDGLRAAAQAVVDHYERWKRAEGSPEWWPVIDPLRAALAAAPPSTDDAGDQIAEVSQVVEDILGRPLREAVMALPAVQSTDGYFGLPGSYYANKWLVCRSDVIALLDDPDPEDAATDVVDEELEAHAAGWSSERHAAELDDQADGFG